MPIAVATIVVGAVVTGALTSAIGATAAAIAGGLAAAGLSFALRSKPDAGPAGVAGGVAPRPLLAAARGETRRIIRAAVQPARWILGRARVGGALVFLGETKHDHVDAFAGYTRIADDSETPAQGEFSLNVSGSTYDRLHLRPRNDSDDNNMRRYEEGDLIDIGSLKLRINAEPVELTGDVFRYPVEERTGSGAPPAVNTANVTLSFTALGDAAVLHMAIALAEGPCATVENLWLGADAYSVSAIGGDGRATLSGPNSAYMTAYFYLSGDGTGGAALRSAFPAKWTASHQGNGIAWAHLMLRQPAYSNIDDRVWTAIPEIEFLVQGLKFTWPGQAAAAWTENAAAVWYWWLSVRRGLPAAAIDETAFQSALTTCGATVYGHPRYSVNGVISAGDDPEAVEDELRFAIQGNAVEWNGTYLIRPGVDRPSVATIDDDLIITVDEARPAPALGERVNQVTAAIAQSAENDWLEWRVPAVDDAAAQARDGETLASNLGTRAFIAYPDAIGRVLTTALRRGRAAATWTMTVRPGDELEMMGIRPADFVRATEPTTGLSDTLCLVDATQLNPDWSVRLALRKQGAGIYDDGPQLGPLVPGRTLDFPTRIDAPPAPTNLQTEVTIELRQDGGLEGIITASADDSVYRTHWRLEGPETQSRVTQGEEAVFTVATLGTYTLEARHISFWEVVGPAAGAVVAVTTALVNVPEPIPLSVTQFGDQAQLVFRNLPERYIAAIDVRATTGPPEGTTTLTTLTEANWLTAGTRLDIAFMSPSIGSQPLVANVTIPETKRYRLFVRLVDTWGNYSDVVELGYYVFALPTVPTKAEGYWPLWPGTLTNFYAWDHGDSFVMMCDRDSLVIPFQDWDGVGGWPFGESGDNAADPTYQPPDLDIEAIKTGEVQINYSEFTPAGNTNKSSSVNVQVWAATTVAGLSEAANRVMNKTSADTDFSFGANFAGRRYFRLLLTYRDGTKGVAVRRLSMNVRESA